MTERYTREAIIQAKEINQESIEWNRPLVKGVTIDGESSLDLDDAFWIEEIDDGAILSVHIADVSERIPIGSALDREAIARVHTRYFINNNLPMLPRILSENQLSLMERQPRPTLTFKLMVSHEGHVQGFEILETCLLSQKRFTYSQADYAISNPSSKWHELLKSCQSWAQILYGRRRDNGSIGGMRTMVGFYLDENGRLVESSESQYHSHQIIQEFMIATNTAAAQWLVDGDCLALYRNHTAKEIAPGQGAMLKALALLGSPDALRARLSSWLNRAEYSPYVIGHFALNLPAYGHFTSPIRRLADLVNHRLIKARLHGESAPYTKQGLESLSGHINQVVIGEDERSRSQYREEAKQALQAQLEKGVGFSELEAKDLGRLIKYADGGLNPALKEEVCTRLNQGKLQVQDLYFLLVRGDDDALKEKILSRLENEVQDAASALAIAVTQEASWEGMEYQELQQGGLFYAWVEIIVAQELRTTIAPGSATRKQSARHRACWLWLESWLKGLLVGPEERVVPKVEPVITETKPEVPHDIIEVTEEQSPTILEQKLSKPLADGQNHVGVLFEICQAIGMGTPIFEPVDLEQGYCWVCRFEWEGRILEGTGTANKKMLAKHRAAMAVLEQLKSGEKQH